MKNIFLSIFIMSAFTLFGQDYNYEASVQKVENNAFYKMLLSPKITSKLNNNFGDIRIYDTAKVEIPYILKYEEPVIEKELFREYKIIEKKHFKRKGYTRIVIKNETKKEIDNIVLRIKNADVRKQLKLNASYDNKTWYVLKDNYYYNSIINRGRSTEIRVLNFPLSDYVYYELLIDDFYDKPINVIQAGCYDLVKENGKYTQISDIKYAKKDTLKKTIIKIPINNNYIDKISFKISNPRYYKREVRIYTYKTKIRKKRKHKKKIVTKYNLSNFNLISNSPNTFNFYDLHTDTIYLEIKNNDNQPLQIDEINFYQLNKYLIAELEPTNKYHAKFSDKKASKPNYDLKYFSDKIPENLDIIEFSEIKKISKSVKSEKSNNINFSNYWLWLSVIGIALLLAYMSYSMIKDKEKKE